MNEQTHRDHAADETIDEALRTYALDAVPPHLHAKVMARVRRDVQRVPRFRPAWIDIALSAFVAGMVGLIFVFVNSTPPEWAQRIGAALTSQAWVLLVRVMLAVVMLMLAIVVFARERVRTYRV